MIKIIKNIHVYFIVYSIAIFCSGIFVGQRFYHPHPPFPPHPFGFGHPFGGDSHHKEFGKKRFFDELALSKQQQLQVDKIMAEHRPKIEDHITAMRNAVDMDKKEIDKEIESILTEDQKIKFAKIKRMPEPPPPPMER